MEHERSRTRSWVLHPDIRSDAERRDPGPALDEGVSLARALPDLDVIGQGIVRLDRAQAGYLFGSGKIDELKEVFAEHDIELVLIDGPVTPVQQRNLEKRCQLTVGVRSGDNTIFIHRNASQDTRRISIL